jgi:class 3 adenylate cyclase
VVTLLLTDVEGSTRLLHELGDRYGEALHEHRRRLPAVFVDHEGVEVDTQVTRSSSRSAELPMRSPPPRTASAHS